MMRRIKIFFGCLLVIVCALPLLPGPGWLMVAEAVAVLEREFVWARRLMDTLAHTHAESPPDSRRPDSIPHPV
jgi:ABC-type cobalamin transport system permease subunit